MAHGYLRRKVPAAFSDWSTWPRPNLDQLSEEDQAIYFRRERAIRMYLDQTTFDDIRTETALSRREVYRLLIRCLKPHPFLGIVGCLALLPNWRVEPYRRRKPVAPTAGSSSGCAGALGALLESLPIARDFIYEKLLGYGQAKELGCDRAVNFRTLHRQWLALLKEQGIDESAWPFVTGDRGYVSLVRYCNDVIQSQASRASRVRCGATPADRMAKIGRGYVRLIRPLRAGTFAILDYGLIDAVSCFTFQTPEGKTLQQVLPRWYIALLIDELTSATWSAHSTLERTPSADSALEALDRAVRPQAYVPASSQVHSPVHIHELVPQLGFSGIAVLKVDNAWCNAAEEVVQNIVFTLGCAVNFGPCYAWVRRDVVEHVMGQLSARGAKRLPSSCGTGPEDARRQDAAGAAIRYRIGVDDLEELLQICCRDHNIDSTERLHWSSPQEVFSRSLQALDSGVFFNPLPRPSLEDSMLLDHVEIRTVRGNWRKGVRPYVVAGRCRYTSPVLASAWQLIGKRLTLRIKRYDGRQVTASVRDTGEPLGQLIPAALWRDHPISWRMRLLICRAGLRTSAISRHDPLEEWKQERKAKLLSNRKRKANQKIASLDALLLLRQERSEERHGSAILGEARTDEVDPGSGPVPERESPAGEDPFGLTELPEAHLATRKPPK